MLEVQQIELSKLKPYPGNAKSHPQSQIDLLVKQIAEGFDQPIVVDKDFVIIKGHGRRMAAMQMQLKTVPVIVRDDLTPQQVKAARIADNKLAETDWDMELLAQELEALDAGGYDLGDLGFDESELESLLGDLQDDGGDLEDLGEVEEDDYEIPEQIETDIVVGDLFEIGPHRLLCGDSTKSDNVARLMNGQKADMVFTDPPYNVSYEGGSKKRTAIQNDNISNFYSFLYDFYFNCFSVMNDGAPIYVAHSELERVNFTSAFLDAGFKLSSIIVWVKNNATFSMNKDYKWRHEPILYGWKQGRTRIWSAGNTEDTVWNIDRPVRSDEHPTMKPVDLCEKAIANSSVSGSLVYEPFCGSGSTMVAAHQLRRKCYAMELDPKYCQVILERMIALDPSLTVLKNGKDVTEQFK
jgi:DNA modification methylase